MNKNDLRSWVDLSRQARAASPPDIDVRHAVLASLPSKRIFREPNLAEKLLVSSHHWGFRLGLSACVLLTALVGYGGYRASEDFSLLVGFNF